MADEEERKSYIILRRDGLVLHTKPVTLDEARWLYRYTYNDIRDRGLRARYLEEWGNVLNVSDYLERLKQLDVDLYYGVRGVFYYSIRGVYEEFDEFMKDVGGLLSGPWVEPEAVQVIKELTDEVREFLQRPVEPKPIVAPVRYLELSHPHVRLSSDCALREVDPEPEWHACKEPCREVCHGVSVFRDSFWLWFQNLFYAWAVVIRRDVDDRELVAALARADRDDAVLQCLRNCDDAFRDVINSHEAELIDRGYEDVVRKAKVILATYELLTAGRREEGVPA